MTALAGIGGSVTEASTSFTNANKWTLSLKGATKDVTPMGASGNWAINLATIKSWTGKISVFMDSADAAQTALLGMIGQTVAVVFNVSGTPHGFSGSAIVTGIDPSVDAQNAVTADFSLTGTGAITYS